MYQYTDFDRQFVHQRAAQYRDQLERNQRGELSDDDFRPLRLQNGWYIQRYAPMLRVAVPYGELASAQLRVLARIAREFDQPSAPVYQHASGTQAELGTPHLPVGYGHFTTRQNVQFNWIPLDKSADVMDLLASVNMHGIQTSGNCIRNITSDALAGVAVDESIDPRPYCEIMRQWSTLHPEFAFLPRKFKIAVSGAQEDRAATAWHDIGLQLLRDADGRIGFKVQVGGGMGRTPVIASTIRAFLPWAQILNYLEAVVRVYNRWGRRDNMYKARIKILVKAEGQRFTDEVEAEYQDILTHDGAPHTIAQAELDRVSASFLPPALVQQAQDATGNEAIELSDKDAKDYQRWLKQNVALHQNPDLRAVTLSYKRLGQAPGDASADQLDTAADLADRFSAGEMRVTHQQNLLLPWVRADQLPALWQAARQAGLAKANIGLLTDMIACPGGDLCALANARSIPVAAAITERFQDLDELFDIGAVDLHISGCINSCGHHHSGHIGILGVDKDGREWYQVSLGGSDGSTLSGAAVAGKVIGPSFAASEVTDVVEALLETYRLQRSSGEGFIATVRRLGLEPFRAAANRVRSETGNSGKELHIHLKTADALTD
ncbi:MAG: nitrite/sulfite reductase [Gammaproteobacteria bacterium]|uniref:nitrite/sulfite reductase n=1 Tax=Rhodoferax sp. TaxID=50421 RepID=UPI001843DE51|nr:nitrite/sulfite reductase [Rhodoferax sp.]MBU3900940.1 nitrite/sulfite reductase [Gammaproteobacteria bacterium]MBA3056499.1 nitrite/sulfite reductase [Rhodoferax sp.]MBU3996831.1 nitrite/sulfite reductase [Gammaproteobacteria bacterium]MBU4017614.1 nitrite/sulfite reductase [Gammaproteobacteria bacterium]MBU4081057.1 nitrite/sulfite reductase [Gammaproteobacteria bacterium]